MTRYIKYECVFICRASVFRGRGSDADFTIIWRGFSAPNFRFFLSFLEQYAVVLQSDQSNDGIAASMVTHVSIVTKKYFFIKMLKMKLY